MNAVDRSPDGSIIATGDDFRRVKIFRYPCPKEKSKFKEYKGHSEFVVNIKFSKDGTWLYSVGGLDKAVFQFEVKGGSSSGSGSGTSNSSYTGGGNISSSNVTNVSTSASTSATTAVISKNSVPVSSHSNSNSKGKKSKSRLSWTFF